MTIITLTVSAQVPVSGADRASDVLRTRVSITQLTLWSCCCRSNPVEPVAHNVVYTRCRASCNGRCSDLLSGKNVCVGIGSPSLAGWAYTANVFLSVRCCAWSEYKVTCVCLSVCPSHFLSTRLQVRHLNGFLQLIAQPTRLYARMCLLGVLMMNNHI